MNGMLTLKNRKSLFAVLTGALCLLLVCAAIVFAALGLQNRELERLQSEKVAELLSRPGEYDGQSIMLTDTNIGTAHELAKKYGAKLRITADGSFATLTLPEGVTVLDVFSSKDNVKDVARMEADYKARVADIALPMPERPQYNVIDSSYSLQTYLDYINMRDVWNYRNGSGVTVAVIDTGIDTDHPEFAGRISEWSYNATEDKIVKNYTAPSGGYDWSLIEDEQGHGTAVTGVIAASMNSYEVVGIAPEVNVIVIKAECDESGAFERTSDLVFGIYYAIERDVKVINMSFGSPVNAFGEATQLATDSDIICVAAAGNEATSMLTYPAADPNVIGVGALENNGWELASYSNYGENVNVVAPGTTYTTAMGGKYKTMNGTSFASPVVAAAVALHSQSNYNYEFATVTEILYASSVDLGDPGEDFFYGYGALDISAFVTEERGTVTFEMLTDELENEDAVFIRNHTLQELPEPERLYSVFDGWYYDPQCTDEFEYYTDVFTGDITLYAKWVNEEDGIPFTYYVKDDNTIEITGYLGKRKYITIPEYIDGKAVTSIGDSAFAGQSKLREVVLPSQLKEIKRNAFKQCVSLIGIEIPENLEVIGPSAFAYCTRLTYVSFAGSSKLVTVDSYAFSFCPSIREFTVPASVKKLDGSAFFGDTSIRAYNVEKGSGSFIAEDGILYNSTADTVVAFPASIGGSYRIADRVKNIGQFAFSYSALSTVDINSAVFINDFAFSFSRLTSVNIPDVTSHLGTAVFQGCTQLTSAKIGGGVSGLSEKAFENCEKLASVVMSEGVRFI